MIQSVRSAPQVSTAAGRCDRGTGRATRASRTARVPTFGAARGRQSWVRAAVLWLVVAIAGTLGSACGRPQTEAPATAPATTAAVPAPDASVAQADNPQCKLFTAAEIAKYIGEPVSPGQSAALGSGCQWLAADGTGDVIVAVVPSSYHEPPTGAAGYRTLQDVGARGFVSPQLDGWVAGAIVGEDAIRVSAAGATASEGGTVQLLKDTIKRRN